MPVLVLVCVCNYSSENRLPPYSGPPGLSQVSTARELRPCRGMWLFTVSASSLLSFRPKEVPCEVILSLPVRHAGESRPIFWAARLFGTCASSALQMAPAGRALACTFGGAAPVRRFGARCDRKQELHVAVVRRPSAAKRQKQSGPSIPLSDSSNPSDLRWIPPSIHTSAFTAWAIKARG